MNKFILLILAAVALAGCSKESFMDQSINEKTNEMKFSVYANSSNAATKGASIDKVQALAKNGGFSLSAWEGYFALSEVYFSNLKITGTDILIPIWTAASQMYWPTDKPLFFSAIYPNKLFETATAENVTGVTKLKNNGTGTTFTYTTPASYEVSAKPDNTTNRPNIIDNSAQADIMYAMNHGSTTDGTIYSGVSKPEDGAVPLNFKHALTQIAFKTAVVSENIKVTIYSIEMHNVMSVADFKTVAPTTSIASWECEWTPATATATDKKAFLAYLSTSTTPIPSSATMVDPGKNNNLMLIPQKLEKWNTTTTITNTTAAYLKINCEIETIEPSEPNTSVIHNGFIYVPFSSKNTAEGTEVWLAGNRVIYTLNFGGGYDEEGKPILTPMTYDVSVEAWNDENGFNDTAKPTI